MPRYVFTCPACGATREIVRPMRQSGRGAQCRRCQSRMRRDLKAEAAGGITDPDTCQADIDRYVEQRASIRERAAAGQALIDIDRPTLSRSLARVPGVNRITGKDGQPYAVFRNKQERRETYQRLGLQEGD